MRRADVLWTYTDLSAAFADVTQSLGAGRAPITLAANDKLYVGHRDWLAGVELLINSAPVSKPTLLPEAFDPQTGLWQELPLGPEFVEQLQTGYTTGETYDFTTSGMAHWGPNPWGWVTKKSGSGFPERGRPPVAQNQASPELFWVRLRNAGTVAVTINRCIPSLFNTYATHQELAEFLGVEEFPEDRVPRAAGIRDRLRAAEDWVDNETRRSARLNTMMRDRYDFNPYGVRLRKRPVWFATRAGVWTGSSFTPLIQGRNQDFWVEQQLGFLYFTRISLGRGLPWSRAASRYLRQPASLEIDYVYGEDFDTSPYRGQFQDIVLRKAAIETVQSADWTALTYGGGDAMQKPEKIRQWQEYIDRQVELMRSTWTV